MGCALRVAALAPARANSVRWVAGRDARLSGRRGRLPHVHPAANLTLQGFPIIGIQRRSFSERWKAAL